MIKFLFSLVVAFLILAFFAQNSLIYYANSRFGSNFGLEEYLANSPLRFGGELQSNISQKIQNFTRQIVNRVENHKVNIVADFVNDLRQKFSKMKFMIST